MEPDPRFPAELAVLAEGDRGLQAQPRGNRKGSEADDNHCEGTDAGDSQSQHPIVQTSQRNGKGHLLVPAEHPFDQGYVQSWTQGKALG